MSDVMTNETYHVRVVQNVTPGPIVISDLGRRADGTGGNFEIQAGDVIDLAKSFTVEQVNKSPQLRSALDRLKILKEIQSPNDVVIVDLKKLADTLEPGKSVKAPPTQYDQNLVYIRKKEEYDNLAARVQAGSELTDEELKRFDTLQVEVRETEKARRSRGAATFIDPRAKAEEIFGSMTPATKP